MKTGMLVRSQKGMTNHWAVISESVSKFAGYLKKFDNLNQSGSTERDRMAMAAKMYKEVEGKPFGFNHCWVMLADHPKWTELLGTKRQRTPSHPPEVSPSPSPGDTPVEVEGNVSASPTTPHMTRPIGRDAAKVARGSKGSCSKYSRTTCTEGAYATHFEDLHEDRLKIIGLKERRQTLMENKEEERILRIDPNECTGWLKEYYLKRQSEIASKWGLDPSLQH